MADVVIGHDRESFLPFFNLRHLISEPLDGKPVRYELSARIPDP